jgi:hypothetical protein
MCGFQGSRLCFPSFELVSFKIVFKWVNIRVRQIIDGINRVFWYVARMNSLYTLSGTWFVANNSQLSTALYSYWQNEVASSLRKRRPNKQQSSLQVKRQYLLRISDKATDRAADETAWALVMTVDSLIIYSMLSWRDAAEMMYKLCQHTSLPQKHATYVLIARNYLTDGYSSIDEKGILVPSGANILKQTIFIISRSIFFQKHTGKLGKHNNFSINR